ncbi:MAG: hypothetical protein KDB23_31295, partial [Planctomycetales bacterium]|nr:hypothetical protein [Planctomycetales bacterium]
SSPTGLFSTSLAISVEGPFGPPAGILENWTLVSTELEGDYDGDGDLTLRDMSFVYNAILTQDTFFDLQHNGTVDHQDVSAWVMECSPKADPSVMRV